MSFTGIPAEAFDFYRRLEADNTKAFWTANKAAYEEAVRAPVAALVGDLEKEFGDAAMFRPYRDVRFSADKSPYKTHQGAFCATAEGVGYYFQIDAEGALTAGGFHARERDRTNRYRAAVNSPGTGMELEKILARLQKGGFEIGGSQVATRPRGCPPDHPRLELMRYETLTASRRHDEEALATAKGLDLVRKDWRALRPFNEWVLANVATT